MSPDYPVILHHFPQSPFSEKIRLILALKNVTWTSVLISRIMPRPDLMPLTGGYRRTPVLQIGADIYCDTQCIVRELERRYPQPTLFPSGYYGLAAATAMWTDRPFFQNTVNLIFGSVADNVPQEFIDDREKLRGAKFDVAAMREAIPQMRDQFRAHLQWIEAQLRNGHSWMCGDRASLCDVNAYMNIWYVRTNLPDLDKMLFEFPATRSWEARIRAIEHKPCKEISPASALEIAANAAPRTTVLADPYDPNHRKPGDQVEVMPDDYGKIKVSGEIVSLSSQHIAIRRHDPRAGEVVVHFPRAGFLVFDQGR
ncbi:MULTISPECIES: glutathione S-transferase family protein [unclassified Bradyrhizobium]|jgi:glutathione S-transferase